MPPASSRRCANHPQWPAFAVCMNCAKTLCQECATQWDGIWYCAACLAARRGTETKRTGFSSWIFVTAATLVLLFLSARLMVWSAVVLAGLH
jgi:hypothetical protein